MFRYIVLCAPLICGFGCAGSTNDPAPIEPQAESPEGEDPVKMSLTSSVFREGERIPKEYTGEGVDKSPPLAWSGALEGAKSFALICDDPDAPSEGPWVHWVIYNIPAKTASLPAGVPPEPQLKDPKGAMQGKNSWPSGQTIGYRGPLPPPGHGVHHYHFVLYALDEMIDAKPGIEKKVLLKAVAGHVVGKAELIGTYSR